ncbi:MAG: amidohydrolase/deacetylase family metallohydrolase [Bryobacteraceae bacterium]
MPSRRHFLGAAAGAFASRASLVAADYDLVIQGGRVIDPAQGIDKPLDVGIRNGKIAALGSNLSAPQTIDARGKLVVQGLIDIHVHARDPELPTSEFLSTGVTTMIDAGSRGADNVEQLIDSFAKPSPNRMRFWLNIGRLGNNPGGRAEFLDNIDQADVPKAIAAVKAHREWIVGIKARLSRGISANRDKEVLRRAIEVGTATNIPVMIHMGDTATPLPQLLAMMRPGDVVSHMYAPINGILDSQGMVLQGVRQARKRGIKFDFGNGLNEHWAWDVAEKAMQQGFPPDTISTDLNLPGRTDQVYDYPNVLSKFLALGMPLKQVIACATLNPSRTVRELNAYGSLRKGAVADVTILELQEGHFDFVDNYKGKRQGSQKLFTRAVVFGGKRVL